MNPVTLVAFLLVYGYFLTEYRHFRKTSRLQKGWFFGINIVTLALAAAVLFNLRPPMPTQLFTDMISPRIHQLLEKVAQIETDR
jgi:hypothetical protein